MFILIKLAIAAPVAYIMGQYISGMWLDIAARMAAIPMPR